MCNCLVKLISHTTSTIEHHGVQTDSEYQHSELVRIVLCVKEQGRRRVWFVSDHEANAWAALYSFSFSHLTESWPRLSCRTETR